MAGSTGSRPSAPREFAGNAVRTPSIRGNIRDEMHAPRSSWCRGRPDSPWTRTDSKDIEPNAQDRTNPIAKTTSNPTPRPEQTQDRKGTEPDPQDGTNPSRTRAVEKSDTDQKRSTRIVNEMSKGLRFEIADFGGSHPRLNSPPLHHSENLEKGSNPTPGTGRTQPRRRHRTQRPDRNKPNNDAGLPLEPAPTILRPRIILTDRPTRLMPHIHPPSSGPS